MKTVKKILCTILVAVMCLTSAPLQGFVGMEWPDIDISEYFGSTASAAKILTETTGKCGNNAYWNFDSSTGELCISGSGAIYGYSSDSYGGYDSPFYWCENIKKVVIENGITSIGEHAFSSCGMSSIIIPNTVTKIEYGAFESSQLKSIELPNSISILEEFVFKHCDELVDVVLPQNLNTISYGMFMYCKSLKNVSMPSTVKTIEDNVFYKCDSLESIFVPSSVTSMDGAIKSCKSLKGIVVDQNNSYYSSDAYGVLFNKQKTSLIAYPIGNKRTAYVIPDSVIDIMSFAFCECNNLESVTIGKNVKTLETAAFIDCTNLNKVTFGESLITIGSIAFLNCSISTISIPGTVREIKDEAFGQCKKLTTATLNKGIITLGNRVFSECNALESITIPNTVTAIGDGTFSECLNLTNVTLSNELTEISDYLFEDCKKLKNVVIPSSVTKIGSFAFYSCSSLESIKIHNKITSIGDAAFAYCDSLIAVSVPDSVISIGYSPFNNCKNLFTLEIGSGVKEMGGYGYDIVAYCDNLRQIVVDPENQYFSSDKSGALFNKDKTTMFQYPIGHTRDTYIVPSTVEDIGGCAFDGANNLRVITLPASVSNIGDFRNCEKLERLIVDKKNKNYFSDNNGVVYSKDLTYLVCCPPANVSLKTVQSGVKYVLCNAFANCKYIDNIVFSYGLEHIDMEAFSDCTSLTSITLPDSVTSIGFYAFYNCSNLKDVYYTGTEAQWKAISIDCENECLTNATIHYNSGGVESNDIKETLDNVLGINYTFTYNDNYFSGSSYTYNHDLAIMSNCLAISAMVKPNSNDMPKCAESFLKKIKFDYFKPYGYGVTPQYNSIACAIASKNLEESDETIIAIGIRGAGYDAEWGGNFNIGTKAEHEGFRLAKEGVLRYLSQFVESNKSKFKSNIKFWVSGYSRAAATANLVAAALDEGANAYSTISSLNYEPNDVYAYTFETPIPTRDKNTKNALYNNIFNIINRIDYVPKVAPEAWGFSRYGVDCFLPSAETYGKEFSSLFSKMKTQYKKITGKNYSEKFTFYDAKFSVKAGHPLGGIQDIDISFVAPNGNISQSRFLDEFLTMVAKYVLKNVNTYVQDYQSSIQKLMVAILGGGFEGVEIPEQTMKEIISVLIEGIIEHKKNPYGNGFRSSLATILANIDGLNLSYTDAYNLSGIVDEAIVTGAFGYNYVYTLIENGSDIKPAHYPEMNFAWVAAMDGKTIRQKIGNTYYRVIKYNCPINIKLYDEDNNLLAEIIDNQVEIAEDCYLSIYIDADGQKCFCLPDDTQYRFEIIGTDNGTMNCSVSEYDFSNGETTETVNYYNIPVETDEEFFVDLDKKDSDASVPETCLVDEVVFVNKNNETIESDEVIEEETTGINVTVASDSENSFAIGGGIYRKGEFTKVEAFACDNEVFQGWYIDNKLVSTDTTYRFMPESDCTIIAKWLTLCDINGHTYSNWITDSNSSCIAEGSKHIECTVCSDILKTESIPMIPHDFTSVVIEATCDKGGYTMYTCSVCGDTYIDNEVAPLGHDLGEVITVKEPTCTELGIEQIKCSRCDYSETNSIEATGHDFDGNICKNCGFNRSDTCSCICHKTGFAGFIYKIVRLFWRLFKIKPVCQCGVNHY